jgi:hypothetical protein
MYVKAKEPLAKAKAVAAGNLTALRAENLAQNKPLQIRDGISVVWIPLPYLGHMTRNRQYYHYSHATSMVLRHYKLHARDGSVACRKYAGEMSWKMLTESRDQRYREDNFDACGWFTDADLLWLVQAGCDKPRFEVLVLQNADTAKGDTRMLYCKKERT